VTTVTIHVFEADSTLAGSLRTFGVGSETNTISVWTVPRAMPATFSVNWFPDPTTAPSSVQVRTSECVEGWGMTTLKTCDAPTPTEDEKGENPSTGDTRL
jgi:hypothetical protein